MSKSQYFVNSPFEFESSSEEDSPKSQMSELKTNEINQTSPKLIVKDKTLTPSKELDSMINFLKKEDPEIAQVF